MKKNIICGFALLAGTSIGFVIENVIENRKKCDIRKMSDKHLKLFLMMNQWVRVKQRGKKIENYFKKNGYKRIAIYGLSYAGETLLDELKNTEIQVAYGIDKNIDGVYADIEIFSADDKLEEVDAIVVTAITFFSEIKENLSKKINCNIVSLEDILYEI